MTAAAAVVAVIVHGLTFLLLFRHSQQRTTLSPLLKLLSKVWNK